MKPIRIVLTILLALLSIFFFFTIPLVDAHAAMRTVGALKTYV